MTKSVPDHAEKVIREAAIHELEGLSLLLESEPETIDSMPIVEVKRSLEEIGLDPNKPLLEGLSRLNVTSAGRQDLPLRHTGVNQHLYELGRQRALSSGDITPREEGLSELASHAEAVARKPYCGLFDPDSHTHDRLLDAEFQRARVARDAAEEEVKLALKELREREYFFAERQAFLYQPPNSSLFLGSAGATLAAIMTPTLRGSIFVSINNWLGWVISLVSGLSIATLIIWAIYCNIYSRKRLLGDTKGGVLGGFIISMGLGLLKMTSTEGPSFVVATILIYVGVIFLLGRYVIGIQQAYGEYAERRAELAIARNLMEVARAYHEKCQQQLAELNKIITAHIRYVEERSLDFFNGGEAEIAARQSVLDGYYAGIAQNIGKSRGVRTDAP